MQPIPLRSAEPVRHIADEEVSPLLPALSRRKILDVTAGLYGYDHWTHLRESVDKSAALVQFDQDLSYDALTSRRVETAKHVERVCGIPFPYAFELVVKASVTRDFRREFVPYELLRADAYQRELAKLDWWRIVSSEEGHPLVPVGFLLGRAAQVGDRGANADPTSLRWLDVIVPENAYAHSYRRLSHLLFLRRGEMIEIEPVPFADMLARSYRPLRRHIDKLREYGGRRDRDDWPARIERAKDQYARLASAAGLPDKVARQATESITIGVRDALREPWYWPLELRGGSASVAAKIAEGMPGADAPLARRGRSAPAKPHGTDNGPASDHALALDFASAIADGLEMVLDDSFQDLSPIKQQPYVYQLLDRLVGQIERRKREPSPAEDAFMRRAIDLYSAAAFYEACAEAYRAATAGAAGFLDGGLVELDHSLPLRRALLAATVQLLSVPQAGDILEAARDLRLEDGSGKQLFTRGKRYKVLGSLDDVWVVDDTGTNNLLSGDYLMNFRIHRRKTR